MYLLRIWQNKKLREEDLPQDQRFQSFDDAFHAECELMRQGIECDVIYDGR